MDYAIFPVEESRQPLKEISSNSYSIYKKARNHGHYQKLKTKTIIKNNAWPVGDGFFSRVILAGLTELSKSGFLHLNRYLRCRSPPLVLRFLNSKNLKMEGKLMEEHNGKFTLVVNKQHIPVTEEVYKAYYQQKEHEVYLDKLSSKYNLSFEECEEKGVQIEYAITSADDFLENTIIIKEMTANMLDYLNLLDSNEKQLIEDLFYQGKSERILSTETGIPPMTIHDRKCRILKKLKKLMKIQK